MIFSQFRRYFTNNNARIISSRFLSVLNQLRKLNHGRIPIHLVARGVSPTVHDYHWTTNRPCPTRIRKDIVQTGEEDHNSKSVKQNRGLQERRNERDLFSALRTSFCPQMLYDAPRPLYSRVRVRYCAGPVRVILVPSARINYVTLSYRPINNDMRPVRRRGISLVRPSCVVGEVDRCVIRTLGVLATCVG